MTNMIGLKVVYLFGVVVFGLSMTFTVLFPSVIILNVCAAISGVGFAVVTTIPGTLVKKQRLRSGQGILKGKVSHYC